MTLVTFGLVVIHDSGFLLLVFEISQLGVVCLAFVFPDGIS